ncbi:MAG: carboxypeptidase-like regulatory domain-containing protein [Bacteroidales bacterium]|nr:carboxypeptidase-like regulatory domain-containing protein [Bacteroidales bacterium]MDY6037285.1 carboxypeptidase-like regulatory domain-containing protein [Paludibacteraceae bacterium]
MQKPLIILLLTIVSLNCVAKELSGHVVDSLRQPIPYASVFLQNNPQIGTITDDNGFFVLPDYVQDDHLVITSIGYEKFTLSTNKISGTKPIRIVLKEQPLMLNTVVVSAKGSKRQQRKLLKQLLADIYKQMQIDFPDNARNYRIVSDVSVYNEDKVVAFDEMVGNIVELPYLKNARKQDSLQIKADFTRYYINQNTADGLRNFDQDLLKRKEKRQLQKIDFEKSEPIHRMLWALDIKKLFGDIYKETGNWSISERDALSQLLTYTKTFTLPGIVSATMKLHLSVDAHNHVQRLSQSVTLWANIPFGYKLSDAQVAALNLVLINDGAGNFDKYRLKTANGKVERNVFFTQQDGQVVVSEKNWAANVHGADKNGQTIAFNQKASCQVLSVETKNVRPYSKKALATKAPRTQIELSGVR